MEKRERVSGGEKLNIEIENLEASKLTSQSRASQLVQVSGAVGCNDSKDHPEDLN